MIIASEKCNAQRSDHRCTAKVKSRTSSMALVAERTRNKLRSPPTNNQHDLTTCNIVSFTTFTTAAATMTGSIETENGLSKAQRKEQGKASKRQRIAEAGGTRPRTKKPVTEKHRFGRVMTQTPCRNKPRLSTLSIALPGSIVANCQTKELRTQLVGQIARMATIYHVDEIIVYDDKLSKDVKDFRNGYRRRGNDDNNKQGPRDGTPQSETKTTDDTPRDEHHKEHRPPLDPHAFMARILQYCECPQYLRRAFFPMSPDLQFAGLLAPVDAPHHVRAGDRSKYREGVVLDKTSPSGKSLVNCGIRGRPVEIDMSLSAGLRCTVQLDPAAYHQSGPIRGKVVSPSAPREEDGTYWGYTTRMVDSLKAVFDDAPFEGGYDLKIGTSERGDRSLEGSSYQLPSYQHALIVFGGVAGIEECVDADENMKIPGSQSRQLFDLWLNICPFQGSRTIRTEEAVTITLARLSPLLMASESKAVEKPKQTEEMPEIHLSDDSVSDESSEEDDV